jgi:aspergillopepsin I
LLDLQSAHSLSLLSILTPHSSLLTPHSSLLTPPNPATYKMLSLTTVLALAIAAQAAPTERASSSFTIPAVHNTNNVRNGTAAMLKAYKKFNLKPTQQFSDSFLNEIASSRKRQDGTVTASPDPNNVEYLVSVSIGGEDLNLDFDSGSADL